MQPFIQAAFITVLFVLARASDLAISAAIARSYIRAICYGIVAILALVFIAVTLFHVGYW